MATRIYGWLAGLTASSALQRLRNQTQSRGGAALAVAWEVELQQEVPSLVAAEEGRQAAGRGTQWVFLGCPGVGKGTYATRLASLLHVPHIAMGDLVRQEIDHSTFQGIQLANAVNKGKLLPDEVVLSLLLKRLERGAACGESGFILDGFPRTISQAKILDQVTDIDLAVNLRLRNDVLISKCLGRRICVNCGKNFNLADINEESGGEGSRIIMPPILPPQACLSKMISRRNDTEEVIKDRLQVFASENEPVEDFYQKQGKLLDFDVPGGIPETWPRLLAALGLEEKESMPHKLVT
ncbi:hypothetical protein O6H91_02G130400 [Diphasiastrum complanatum]|uniref:Uncharacterized protein n=1 Tax=Diphasiastrum complanatum TaxID=34168 RepID=A0ACC2EL02_DIPCM|nr:hypothetical protein O6H91_02G130400 [Diphasiastrum complanatum]